MDEWTEIAGAEHNFDDMDIVMVKGRYGDVYGPIPALMVHPDAWTGDMLHASHDVIAFKRMPAQPPSAGTLPER